jgi:hypothetical protein
VMFSRRVAASSNKGGKLAGREESRLTSVQCTWPTEIGSKRYKTSLPNLYKWMKKQRIPLKLEN